MLHGLTMSSKSKRFPYASGFLTRILQERAYARDRALRAAGMPLVALGAAAIGIAVGFAVSLPLALVAAGIGFAAGSGILEKKIRTPRDADEARRFEAWAAAGEMRTLDSQRRLYKNIDPVAMQLMEAAAFHWTRVISATEGAYWSSPNLPAHWQAVRSQAIAAADAAMEELVLLCHTCMGTPQRDRKTDLKDVFEDFIELDIGDALQGLRQLTKADWQDYAHRSPNAAIILEPGKQIAERLRDLADEVESMSSQVLAEEPGRSASSAITSLDVVLSEMRTVRQAETELHQQQGL